MNHVTTTKLAWIALLALVLAWPAAGADWTYYSDDFSSYDVESDAYLYSTFWTLDATPLPEPYLQYLQTTTGRGVLFMGYGDEPARLGYCLPLATTHVHRIVTGTFAVDVSYPCNATVSQSPAGELYYSLSSDGITWSGQQYLGAGRNTIPVSSNMGTCYVVFSGTRALIESVQVSLSTSSATIRVPADYSTIQGAIDAARTGDVIVVSAGTYTSSGNWDIDFRGKAIAVCSADGAASTIIDCGSPAASSRRGFYFYRGEGERFRALGFHDSRRAGLRRRYPLEPLPMGAECIAPDRRRHLL